MKRLDKSSTFATPSPRRPEPTVKEILEIAALLQARQRRRLDSLSHRGRLRQWGR